MLIVSALDRVADCRRSVRAVRRRVAALVPLFLLSVPAPGVSAQQPADPAVAIEGRVTDPQGEPVAGARISATLPSGEVRSAVAGGDGRYRLVIGAGVASRVRVSADGYHAIELDDVSVSSGVRRDIVLEPSPFRLAAVSVIGRTRPELAAIPGAATIIGPAVLRDRAPISVMDALRTVPGVHTATEDPFGLNLNVGFRGLPPRRSSRTLLLEDGMPILLGPYGDPSMHYAPPVEAIERIEVVKGSGQVMNGPQTVGGVVNFVTRRPPESGSRGQVTIGGGSSSYRNGHVWAGTTVGGAGLALDYTYREGDGVRREQSHRLQNTLLSAMLPVAAGQSLLLKASMWRESSNIAETGLTQAEFDADPLSLPFAAAGRFNVRRYAGQLMHELERDRYRIRTSAYVSSTDRASWRQSGESEERLGEDDYAQDFNCAPGATSYDECGNQGRPREYRVAAVEPRLSFDLGAEAAATVDVGARLLRENARRRQYTGNTPHSREGDAVLTRDNEIATDAIAGYVQVRARLGAVTLSPALRVERLSQVVSNRFPGSEAEVDDEHTQLLPGIGATYAIDGATLFAGVHRGYAPPRPADVYQPMPGQPVVLVDPETSWNWELGARVDAAPGINAEATLFRMDFGNQIIEAPAGAGQRFTNGGRTVHQGIELSGRLSVGTLRRTRDDLALTATLTYLPVAEFTRGDERGTTIVGNRLPYAPRTLASASAVFSHRTGLAVGTSLEYTGEQFADAENTVAPSADGQEGILPSYSVVNAFASYAIRDTGLHLRASVRNVFDRVYIAQRNEGILTGMRRIARIEVQWSFQDRP